MERADDCKCLRSFRKPTTKKRDTRTQAVAARLGGRNWNDGGITRDKFS
jgi:hypothetical protein